MKIISAHDLLTQRPAGLAQIREAMAETKHILDALRLMETRLIAFQQTNQVEKNLAEQTTAMKRLHGWIISLNESYVGLQLLTTNTEFEGIDDKLMIAALKTGIENAQFKWERLIESARWLLNNRPANYGRK